MSKLKRTEIVSNKARTVGIVLTPRGAPLFQRDAGTFAAIDQEGRPLTPAEEMEDRYRGADFSRDR